MPFVFEIPQPEPEIKLKISLPASVLRWAESEAVPKGGTVEQFVVSALRHIHQESTLETSGGAKKRNRQTRRNPDEPHVQG